ncbi:MAG TPA: prepilin peptidase [Candidatus Paceibacterota bacterium]
MINWLPFLLFVSGLAVGSFLNVLTLRYDPDGAGFGKAFHGRSHCPNCKKTLRWYELIPVLSFLFQLGRCRSCKTSLSWQYPLVELASGFVFLIPLYLYSPIKPTMYFSIESVVWVLAFLLFIVVWLIDFRLYIIPDEVNIALAGLGLVLIGAQGYYGQFGQFDGSFIGGIANIFGLRESVWVNHIVAAIAAVIFLGLIIFISKGRAMGMGDLKLLGALGLLFGWPDVLFIAAFAFILGSIMSIYLIFLRKLKMKDAVPFGPFLVLAAMIIFVWGKPILESYFRFFNLV